MDTPSREPNGSDASPFVIEATVDNFERDVIERSREVPVVVDFWAEWCGPCRALGPVLERLAGEYAGKFVLVKADTEAVPELAGAFGVQSIPAVFGLRDARVVDRFVGALPEPAIRAWLDGLMPTPAERTLADARRLESTDPAAAEGLYREALALAPNAHDVQTGLARVLLRLGRLDESRELVRSLEGHGYFDDEVEAIKAELDLKSLSENVGGVDAARRALADKPDDPKLRLDLAEALAAAGQHEEALATCLALVEDGPKDLRDPARLAMLKVFQILPADSALSGEYRRRLSAALY